VAWEEVKKVKFNPLNLTRLIFCGGVVEIFEYVKEPTGFVFKFIWDYKVSLPYFKFGAIIAENQPY
jgi:hypothetical protein